MPDKLLQWLVQEIPEELSVCEFDCCNTECTISDWAVCELRNQVMAYDQGITKANIRAVKTEAAA